MANFSDGVNGSSTVDISVAEPSMPAAQGNLRVQLQALLDGKEKQLRLAGTLGQRILAQQMELEERISQLNDLEAAKTSAGDDEVENEIRGKLQELKTTMDSWETETQEIFGGLGNKINDVPPSPPTIPLSHAPEDPSVLTSPAGPSAAQSSRRAKNAAHRANDVEFAFEIGSSLLTEVRRLQSLLGERDKAIQDMKEEKDDLNKLVENLTAGLRTQEASADKYKEENWNLEVMMQDLRSQLSNAQNSAQNSEAERKRIAKQLVVARDAVDQHKTEAERLTVSLADFKAKHETDVAQMRKQAAGLQRDKSDLQSTLEVLKSDMAKKERSIKRFGSPLTPNGLSPYTPNPVGDGDEDEDVFGTTGASNRRKLDSSALFGPDALGSDFADSSPDPSPSRPHLAPNHPSNEIEALKQSLAHAQRQVNMLRGTVQREKEMRINYKRKLMESEGQGGQFVDDDEEVENVDPTVPRTRVARGRGRAAGRHARGGRLVYSQLALSPSAPDSDFLDDIDETGVAQDIHLLVSDPPFEQEDIEQSHPEAEGTEEVFKHRMSVEDMDPAFANVLRNAPSPAPLHGSSPSRDSPIVSTRGGRRLRGGVPRQAAARPPSIVEPAGALAVELGMSSEILEPDLVVKPEIADFACQTEPDSEPVTIPPKVDFRDIGVQVDDLAPGPPPVITSEVSTQVTPFYNDTAVDAPITTLREAHVQTLPVPVAEIHTQTMPMRVILDSLSTQIAIPPTFDTSTRSGTVVSRSVVQAIETDTDAAETETETEGEYTDAREFVAATPTTGSMVDLPSARARSSELNDFPSSHVGPQESTTDFYSVGTGHHGSDADDSDQESIKASRLPRNRTSSRVTSLGFAYAQYQGGIPPLQPRRIMNEEWVQVEEKKADLKEISIQTDDWSPPLAPPPSPPSYGLFRVGSHTQQFQYIAPSTASPTSSPQLISADVSRDSTATVIPRRTATSSIVSKGHERGPSIEAALSGDDSTRVRTSSGQSLLAPVDKTRPPTMMLPPPPRMPPPASIPDKKSSTSSSRDMPPPRDIPPPRPTSPPPPELIQRATTPTFGGQALLVPSRNQVRQHGASMPPSQHTLGHRPSTNSFRSAANAAAYASGAGITSGEATRRQRSTASLVSSRQSSLSRQSSMSSDRHNIRPVPGPPKTTPNAPGHAVQSTDTGTTDPAIIHAITQTMIGEFLYKYTRRVVGKGHGEKRHKRFFWVHPYTKTLYWSSADPGSSNVSESSAKSAYIDAVRSVLDPNPMPPGLYQYSVVVSTPQREMKITAPTKERHDIWFNALNYLLARPANATVNSPQSGRPNPPHPTSHAHGSMRVPADNATRKDMLGSPRSVRSIGSALSGDSWNITPRAQRSQSRLSTNGSVGKRSGTPAAEYLRYGPDGPLSPSKSDYEYVPGRLDDDQDLDFEIHESIVNGEGFEGLENVRACCDGRHDLGTLSRKPHHHHHHHHHNSQHTPVNPQAPNQNLEPNEPVSRPVSPSAWSFRSRAGSTTSHGESGSIWSKFGSKRSKVVPPVPASPGGK